MRSCAMRTRLFQGALLVLLVGAIQCSSAGENQATGTTSTGTGGTTSTSGTTSTGTGGTGGTCSPGCQEQRVMQVAPGLNHACALLSGGKVKCWGRGGRLGLGDNQARGDGPGEMGASLPAVDVGTGAKAVMIAVGLNHTCALLEGGSVKCWGSNEAGELGLGDTLYRGDMPGQMGDALPPVDLGKGKIAIGLAAGTYHTCALLQGGSVKCWGYNGTGQLGLGDTLPRGDTPGQMGDALPPVDLGTGAITVALAAGDFHTCALLQGGSVKCWGLNDYGQLGLGDQVDRGLGPGQMGDALPAVNLGTGKEAIAIAAGLANDNRNSTCALFGDGSVKCWGGNTNGELGLGDNLHRGDGPGEMGDALPAADLGTGKKAIAIAGAGWAHCALLEGGSVKCWGVNNYGALGLGDTLSRGNMPGQMGDALPTVKLW